MKKNIEVILDTQPNEGCGCNCGCAGSNVVEDMDNLVEELKQYKFDADININVLPISEFDLATLINKINALLDNTNATFRVNEDNVEASLSEILPLVVLDGTIITAYGVPTLNDVIMRVEKSI